MPTAPLAEITLFQVCFEIAGLSTEAGLHANHALFRPLQNW